MGRPRLCRWCLLLCAISIGTGRAAAQSVSAAATFERYSFDAADVLDIESLTLLSVPFGATYDAGRGITFRLSGAYARASLMHENGDESTVSGPGDTELSARIATAGGGAAVTAILLLPTGHESLTYEEMFVAGAIAADLLPFAVRDFGTGGGAGASVALARPFGAFAAGVSVGYVVARNYEPLSEQAFEYGPGDQLHIRAAIDRTIGRSAKIALRADWQMYGDDTGDGTNVFQPGDRLQLIGSYDFALGRSNAIAYIGWLKRDEGEYVAPSDFLAKQRLLFAGGGVRVPLGGSVLVPSIDLRSIESDGQDRSGYTLGFGASLESRLGSALIMPEARLRLGSAESSAGSDTGFMGVNVGLTIRFGTATR
jgi:hypothetical protein